MDRLGGDVSFDWSGTSFECRFTGGSLAMRVSDTKKNYYNLTVDGRDAGVVTTFGTDSVVVLAEKLGRDPEALRAEVEHYNAMVDAGEDADFGRDITTMAKIQKAPFYAIEEFPAMPACSGGARRNIKGQVLTWDNQPIEGLYSAGELGSLVCNLYQNGTYLHEAICSGRAAIDTMLGGRAELKSSAGGEAAAPWAEAEDGDYSVFVTGLHDPYEVIFTIKGKKLVDMKIGEGKENMFMTDEQFAEIAQRGGLVGINLYTPFLVRQSDSVLDDAIDHIERFIGMYGEKIVALGCDFDGCDQLPVGIEGLGDMYRLADRMLALGYREETVRGLFYDNAFAFVQKML